MKLRPSMLALALVLVASPVRAEAPEGQRLAAEALFAEGRRLMEAGDFEHACPKLRDSQALDPGLGTLLNLAVCYEKSGKSASAWTRYKDALALARTALDGDRERLAQERLTAIEPSLPKLRLRVRAPAGLAIAFDDVALPATLWTLEIPVDPGLHTLRASAEGRIPWTTDVVAKPGESSVVDVPELATLPPPPPQPQHMEPTRTPNRWRVPAVIALGAGGLAAATVGGICTGVAMVNYDESRQYCSGNQCSQRGVDLRGTALSLADAATISFVLAGSLVLTGALVWLIVPSSRQGSLVRASSFTF